jgi:hypothetical protein
LTLPLHDLVGPSFVINPLNFFTNGPGHNAGHNEAVDYADVFQDVAFQGTFLFRFFYIITCCKQWRCFSYSSNALRLWARQRARIQPAIVVDLN